ncbi:H-NS family nucleoid-associated regulatory protein [Photorhabdus heterorhabditis]|uniref:H-NS histone family protein n=1 Tax=Photorhabdus heterorhabditis TaxID=880156 RepID=UPI001561DD8F|nr:H-NS family nucleoid-associated regulatory protein [Photorhabdus heterorhabditis]NRN30166.1 H-NS histone family protein [Photorhabdus heterorhabditis subsp. aluminescens]
MTELTKEQEYEIVSKYLTGLTTLRKFAQTKDFDWLEEVYQKLEIIVEESRESSRLARLEIEEKEQKRLEVLRIIAEMGFDIKTINIPITLSGFKPKKSNTGKGKTRKPKYQFNENGEIKYWSGNGKRPLGLQKLLNEGHLLDEFLIKR